MSITTLVLTCALLLLVLTLLAFFRQHDRTGPIVGVVVSAAGLAWVAHLRDDGGRSFGSSSGSLVLFVVILVGVVFGMAGEVYFRSRRTPAMADVIKPMLASPIVLLPLYGAVRTIPTYDTSDLLWWALLGFQNGWFWKTVLEKAVPKTGDK